MESIVRHHFSIASYNCRGFNSLKSDFINQCLSKVDILFIQEHWLTETQFDKLTDISRDFLFTSVCGFDNTKLLLGRPYGGCAILWRSCMQAQVSVLCTNSRRICAIRLCVNNLKFLLVNVYLPHEDGDENVDLITDLLIGLESLILAHQDCHLIVGGDLNVDFSRTTSVHTALLNSFCVNNELYIAQQHSSANIDYTYNFSMTRFSVIDHFLLSAMIYDGLVESVSVCHDMSNLSDHEPLILTLNLDVSCLSHIEAVDQTDRPSWVKATCEHLASYRSCLSEKLSDIPIPTEAVGCHRADCHNRDHTLALNVYVQHIIKACSSSALETIPAAGSSGGQRRIPGWTQYVEPARQKSLFWHKIWQDCGRPRSGPVADSMRKTRASYHYAIRISKRNETCIIRERIAGSLLTNNLRDFWLEVKRIRSSRAPSSKIIDGLSEANKIAELFTSKYCHLYNSVTYDSNNWLSICNRIELNACRDTSLSDCIVSVHDINLAVSKLKSGKSDYSSHLFTDHFKNANDVLFAHISLLFTGLISHGFIPECFLSSTIKPIPKGHGSSVTDSGNYRGIAISSVFAKILDNVILLRYQHLLDTNELQFGFKKHHSTHMCTMVLKETIAYYNNSNSSVFCTFLDATKAFDRINYCKLFQLLEERKLPPCILRILLCFYRNNLVNVSWLSITGDSFVATNGVKQGGILSPVLFCVYMDSLLERLATCGVGCYIGHLFVGCLAYADDIVLLAPTPTAMRLMLRICDEFALQYDMNFNATKTKCVIVRPHRRKGTYTDGSPSTDINYCFKINGISLQVVDSYRHLGHIINAVSDDSDDIHDKRMSFIGQVNSVLCFFNSLYSSTKQKLFHSYCSSFFGCELWSLANTNISDFCIAWHKAIRRIWSLPNRSHCALLPLLAGCLPIYDIICTRYLAFINACINHSSYVISSIARYAVRDGRASSPMGLNLVLCAKRYCCSTGDLLLSQYRRIVNNFYSLQVSNETKIASVLLTELLCIRDGEFNFSEHPFLSRDEIELLINDLCTS